ncbi:MAG: hypothetical protein ACREQ8_12165 [Woeseiaceae bacterium]
MKFLIGVLLTLTFGSAWPQETFWKDKDGNPVPDTAAMKSEKGFGGWLVVTADHDWEQKWQTPSDTTPYFSEASTVAIGERIMTLIFFANPMVGEDGIVEVRCDLKVVRPDGTVSIDVSDSECFKGPIDGPPANVRLSTGLLGFIGEPGDPLGVWVTDVKLTDMVRGVSLELRTTFELVGDEI